MLDDIDGPLLVSEYTDDYLQEVGHSNWKI